MVTCNGISVVIPTYNRLSYLYGTLSCLLNQNNPNNIKYEIIVIDSGDDLAESLVRKFEYKKSVFILYKYVKNCKNRSQLRNLGASLAKYDILCFLDNDMLVSPDFIQTCFSKHLEQDDLVLLGSRKSLTQFKIENINLNKVLSNFSILNNLAYYNDERLVTFKTVEPWRFVFSHTLSLKKDIFEKVGKFNNKFGKFWGFEDLELGFRLQLNKSYISFVPEIVSYHQPHFSQSCMEQEKMRINGHLFLKLHNCYEVELYQCFYSDFDKYYPLINDLKKKFEYPEKNQLKNYDLIFACLFSSEELQKSKKCFLGALSYYKSNSKKKILLNKIFFDLPRIIQQSIISESFRIGKEVYVESNNTDKINLIRAIAADAGLLIDVNKKSAGICSFIKRGVKKTNIFIIFIPCIYESEKRFVFLWLAVYLIKHGYYVNIRDIYSIEDFSSDDFCFSTEDRLLIEENLNKSYGKTTVNFIISTTMLLNSLHTGLPNSSNTYVVNDVDFEEEKTIKEYKLLGKANHFDNTVFSLLSFISIYSVLKNRNIQNADEIEDSFCCFMENGFYEDGIDILLKVFSLLKEKRPFIKLIIKMPDYEQFENVSFPLHNVESKKNKLFNKKQAWYIDETLLRDTVHSLKLENNTEIIKKNYSIEQIIDIVNKTSCLICASRFVRIIPEVYISILLKKRTVICSHHKLIGKISECCSIAKSRKSILHKELKIPVTDINLMQNVYRPNVESLFKEINSKKNRNIAEADIRELVSRAKEFFDMFFK